MSVYNLRTTVTPRMPVSSYPERSPAEYAAKVAARFGGQMPSFEKLAEFESKEMRKRMMTNPGAESIHRFWQGGKSTERYHRQHEQATARMEEVNEQIFAILEQGEATARDVQRHMDLHLDTVRDHLRRLRVSGQIEAKMVRQVHVYSMPWAEAAE